MTAAQQTPRRVPPALAVALSELMIRKDRYAAFPGALAVFAPYVTDRPREAARFPKWIDIECVHRLGRFLQAAGAIALLPEIVTIATPFLVDPTPDRPPPGENVPGLSEREHQVLVGISDGQTNAAIGRDLHVSEDTVKTHARRLFEKLGARDRAHAVRRSFELGHLKIAAAASAVEDVAS